MTKKLLFAATVALAISSCTQVEVDEVATQTKEPIRFEQFVGKATRGDVVTNDNLNEFDVFVKKYKADGTGEEVVKTTVTKKNGTWTPDKVMYWEPGAKYCFAAVYAVSHSAHYRDFKFDVTSETAYALSYEKFYDNAMSEDGSMDVVAAICPAAIEAKASGNEPVQFTFKHIMAKVQFTITNGNEEEELNLPEVEFARTGVSSFTLANTDSRPTWQNGDASYPLPTRFNDITIPASESKTMTIFVIPQDGTVYQPNLKINRERTVGDRLQYNLLTGKVTEWEAGKAYNYNLTINQERVKFGVTVKERTGDDEVNL